MSLLLGQIAHDLYQVGFAFETDAGQLGHDDVPALVAGTEPDGALLGLLGGDAVERRSVFVQCAGLRPAGRQVRRGRG